MATPRLKGASLRAVRRLGQTPPGRRMLLAQTKHELGFDVVANIDPTGLPIPEVTPQPWIGRDQHGWEDAGLDVPSGPRVTGDRLRKAFAAKDTTPVEVLDQVLAALDEGKIGEAQNSPFVVLDRERAQEAAKASAARWKKKKPLGPLDGVIVPVKDQFFMQGTPMALGTRYRHDETDTDAHLVAQLRKAGAVLLGRVHATEWGFNPVGFNPNHPMPRNVYNGEHAAGGSSTGSGVACGLGLATVAVSSDGGGSIRTPSCFAGVFGLKPTFRRFSTQGDAWATNSLSVTGPIGQSVSDLVDLMSMAAHVDAGDPMLRSMPQPVPTDAWRKALGRGVKGARIVVPEGEWRDADPAVVAHGEASLKALEKDGATLIRRELPYVDQSMAVGVTIFVIEVGAALQDDVARFGEQMGDDLRLTLALSQGFAASEFMLARRVRGAIRRSFQQTFADADLVALPTTGSPAPPYPMSESGVAINDNDAMTGVLRYAFQANLTGLPAGQVPTGMVDGLPVGMQLIGDAWDEASVLAAMGHCERVGTSVLPLPRDYLALLG